MRLETATEYENGGSSSRKITYEEAADAISTAFTRWTGATCPTEGKGRSRTSIDVRDLGPADCAKVEYVSGVANQNVVLFRDDTWKYGKQVLGLTTVVYNPDTGEIYNADMEINTLDMEPLAIRDPVAPDAYDFASVVTHEAGHGSVSIMTAPSPGRRGRPTTPARAFRHATHRTCLRASPQRRCSTRSNRTTRRRARRLPATSWAPAWSLHASPRPTSSAVAPRQRRGECWSHCCRGCSVRAAVVRAIVRVPSVMTERRRIQRF